MNINDLLNDFAFDDFSTETETNIDATDYAAWVADMDAMLAAAIAEDYIDIEDEFYESYRGAVKPIVYHGGEDNENQYVYNELIDNCKPIHGIFE